MGNSTQQTETKEPRDMELILAYRNGNADAFDILYERYRRQLYAYLNKLLPGRQAQADDMFQQTWIRAIAKLDRYQEREMFLAWLLRIAHNLTIDSFRAGRRRNEETLCDETAETAEAAAGHAVSPAREMDRRELADAIDRAVEKLPPDQREVFLLRQEDVAFREIAEIQNCSINTCLARMRYAVMNLRSALREWTVKESR